MKRVALFLKEKQIRKLKVIARKQELPWAFVVRHAIDFYFEALRIGRRGRGRAGV